MTGKEIDKADWILRGPSFGDYNRNNRCQMAVAYLDGKTPCILIAKGTYRRMVVEAYQLNNNKLEKLWRWDGDEENPVIRSQGAHGISICDVDGDGRDEIILGSAVLDDNGTLLWSAGLGHPDKVYVTDIDPNHPGPEIFFACEVKHEDGQGVSIRDAKTGQTIWKIGQTTFHVGDGMVADIDPNRPGLECFATEDRKGGSTDKYLLDAKGKLFATNEEVPGCRNWIWWDADKVRETIGRKARPGGPNFSGESTFSIVKYKGDNLTKSLKGRIVMTADLTGDWREEIVTALPNELRVYSTTIPATDRRVTLMQDNTYRQTITTNTLGYQQSPVPSFYLGE
jgi:rhamnogalacturonan endolyase